MSPKTVVGKILQRLKEGEAADAEQTAASTLISSRRERRRPTNSSTEFGIRVEGVTDVLLRLAKCCRPVPGDEIVGYISLGQGHHDPPRGLLQRAWRWPATPIASRPVAWEGG